MSFWKFKTESVSIGVIFGHFGYYGFSAEDFWRCLCLYSIEMETIKQISTMYGIRTVDSQILLFFTRFVYIYEAAEARLLYDW